MSSPINYPAYLLLMEDNYKKSKLRLVQFRYTSKFVKSLIKFLMLCKAKQGQTIDATN